MEKTKNIPKIRFKGYKDEWEKDIIENVGDFYSGGTPASNNESYYNGDIPFIRSGEIKNVTTELCISKKGLESSSAKLVKKGDVLLALYGATSGEVSISKINGAINQAILAIIPNKNFNNYFIKNYFVVFKNEINNRFLQGGQKNLSGNLVKSIIFNRPKIEEQKQIGSLFKNLDEKLEIEREKHEKLVNFKKAMLENVFPKEGEKRPKIRFDCYNDDWKLLKLGELGEISSAGVDKVIRPNEKEVYLLNYMDVYKNKQPSNNNIHEFMISSAKEHQILSKNVLKGDVFFTPSSETSDDIGHSMCIYNNVENLVYSYHILRFRPYDNKLDIYFSNYFANIYPVRKQLIVNCQGAQRMTLKMEEFNNLVVAIPSINEQKLIGSFFKSLDEKIQVSEEKIIKIENFKKAMMEAMFV